MSVLTIDGALPLLTAAYRMDRLVPFVGSGLSMPACRSWSDLVLETLKLVRLEPDAAFSRPEVPPDIITRQADEAMRLLRAMPRHQFVQLFEGALYADRSSIPPNSAALATIRWPLIVTTNYDDVLLRAFDKAHHKNSEPRPRILGRGRSDCHTVVRSLDILSTPILWAIQGFLHPRPGREGDDLVAQMVLSHKQYQDAINNAPVFRRAFGEVFQRRSLLFIGSGILENYLVNLFGEVVAQHGPSPRRHYALLRRSQLDRLDARFLSDRLGIVPVLYEDYAQIAAALVDLAAAVTTAGEDHQSLLKGTHFVAVPASLGYQIVTAEGPPLRVVVESARLLRSARLAEGREPQCHKVLTAISVGREGASLLGGPMAEAVLGPDAATLLAEDFRRWHPDGYVYVSAHWPVLAVAARVGFDVLDLGLIPDAMGECLRAAEELGATCLQIGLLAAGNTAPWHPVFPLIQMLAGIRDFWRRRSRTANAPAALEEVRLSLADPRAWYPAVSGQIPIAELLSSDLRTIFVELESDAGNDLFTHVVPHGESSLEAIQRYFNLDRHDWHVELSPAHSDGSDLVVQDRQITSYSTVRIQYRSARSKDHHAVP